MKKEKYIPKAQVAQIIIDEDTTNVKTFDELMRYTRKELGHRMLPTLLNMCAKELKAEQEQVDRVMSQMLKHAQPAGIVPCPEFKPKIGEVVFSKEALAKMGEELTHEAVLQDNNLPEYIIDKFRH